MSSHFFAEPTDLHLRYSQMPYGFYSPLPGPAPPAQNDNPIPSTSSTHILNDQIAPPNGRAAPETQSYPLFRPRPHYTRASHPQPYNIMRMLNQSLVEQTTAPSTTTFAHHAPPNWLSPNLFQEPKAALQSPTARALHYPTIPEALPRAILPAVEPSSVSRERSSRTERVAPRPTQTAPIIDDIVMRLQGLVMRMTNVEYKVDALASRFTPPSSTEETVTDEDSQDSTSQGSSSPSSETSIFDPQHNVLPPSYVIEHPPDVRAVAWDQRHSAALPQSVPFAALRPETTSNADLSRTTVAPSGAGWVTSHRFIEQQSGRFPTLWRDSSSSLGSDTAHGQAALDNGEPHTAWIARYDLAWRTQMNELRSRLEDREQLLHQLKHRAAMQHDAQTTAYTALKNSYQMQARELDTMRDRVAELEAKMQPLHLGMAERIPSTNAFPSTAYPAGRAVDGCHHTRTEPQNTCTLDRRLEQPDRRVGHLNVLNTAEAQWKTSMSKWDALDDHDPRHNVPNVTPALSLRFGQDNPETHNGTGRPSAAAIDNGAVSEFRRFPNDPVSTTRTVSNEIVPDLRTAISPINRVGPEANSTPLQNARRGHTSPVLPRLHN
ncbi:uncharacterized protein K489DRAFT_366339 [Dissoconium aciculare CBS 342.82]|uniref:Uncharacterized protein n=1 Tax=Dissoconium aciculare CBS 342.82 TaxID=1314786 RepID=A0A6J3MGR5_9PEZI|nr:uncharacterized protein K489DRAFT_366339 [Dissoconium aciculare CBS 342.82]KAF1827151.1 hypothetical protein K489DRAFT_366339 [Dissoconium aciculare CBS 342.82]